MDDVPRYGRRRVSRMRGEWEALRRAVAAGDVEAITAAFDRCEEWVGWAFGAAAERRGRDEHL